MLLLLDPSPLGVSRALITRCQGAMGYTHSSLRRYAGVRSNSPELASMQFASHFTTIFSGEMADLALDSTHGN